MLAEFKPVHVMELPNRQSEMGIKLYAEEIKKFQKVLEEKKQIVASMSEQFKTAVSGVFVDYCGLSVEEDTQLRNKLREAGVEYKVIKNTLTRFAAKEVGFDELDPILNGPTSLAVSMTDEVAPAKVIAEFAKTHEQLEIKAGFLDGKVLAL